MKKGKKSKKGRRGSALSDDDLVAIVRSRKSSALGANNDGDDISTRREEGLKRYLGKPYGDERSGQSKVVTRQCLEAVEWALPSLMRIFASTDKVVEFTPVGANDEEAAEQETEYVNHTFDNASEDGASGGFVFLYNWIKDILMNPVGYAKVYWEDKEVVTTEEYEGLSGMELAELMEDDELEPIEQEEILVPTIMEGVAAEIVCYNVKFKRTHKDGHVVVKTVPPEEITVDGKLASVVLDGADYVCHTTFPSRSDLINDGYDKDIVYGLPASYGEKLEDDEKRSRHDETVGNDGVYDEATDDSTEIVEVNEHYLFIDYDGDGVAEYRFVKECGKVVLDNDEIDYNPLLAGCAVPLPHTHVGLAWQELVEDLQKIYTTLTRQTLNNAYRVNNPRTVVGRGVNLSDVINDLPNSPIRAKDVSQLRMEPVQPVIQHMMPVFGMLDQAKETRTGVSSKTMGLDADELSRVAKGAYFSALEQSNQRLELLARIIGEFSLKPMFKKIHHLLLTNQKGRKEAKLSGEWVEVSPSEWKARTRMKVLVGTGTGNKQVMGAALDKIMGVQAKLKQAGSLMVSDANMFNSAAKMVELAGYPNVEAFFTNPKKITPEQKQQAAMQKGKDPLAEAQMELAKVEREKAQLRNQEEKGKLMHKMQETAKKNDLEIAKLRTSLAEKDRILSQRDRDLDIKEHGMLIDSEIDSAKIMQDEDQIDRAQQDARRDFGGRE